MAICYLKYLFIICDSTYAFPKILNLSTSQSSKSTPLLLVHTLLLPLGVCFLRQYAISFSLIIMTMVSVCTFRLSYKIDFSRTIVAVFLSYGISYSVHAISSLAISMILHSFAPLSYSLIFVLVDGGTQLLFVHFLFRIKRLRHGLSFLDDIRYSAAGVFISVSMLIAFSFIGMKQNIHLIYEILAISIFLCGVTLWFWWKTCMTHRYLAQLHARDLDLANSTAAAQQSEIDALQKENEELSKIIHKDNKLIPALTLSVREFLDSIAKNEDQQIRVSRTQELLEQLDQISHERYVALQNYESVNKKLPSCGLPVLDALLAYMLWKSSAANINLDLVVWNSLKPITETAVTEQDISTVLADLIENAIIATSRSNSKKSILIEVGLTEGHYFISVSDSGVPFPKEVLENWGIQRITTNAGCGGSGIGMMSTHDICKRYGASFSIENFGSDMPYSKRIMICFDNANQFRIK